MSYRLHSFIDDSNDLYFDCYEDMDHYVDTLDLSSSDWEMQEWFDDRITPAKSGWVSLVQQ